MNFFAPLTGISILVLPDAVGRSWLDFESRRHERQREYFGLGLHFVVCPAPRQASNAAEKNK